MHLILSELTNRMVIFPFFTEMVRLVISFLTLNLITCRLAEVLFLLVLTAEYLIFLKKVYDVLNTLT